MGPNEGKKFDTNQRIYLFDNLNKFEKKKINYINSKIEFIRVLKGTNFNYFSELSQNNFVKDEYKVSKLTDRMGMRLESKN